MMKKGGCGISMIGLILVIVGALNWGLVGVGYFFGGNWNLVNLILGSWPMLEHVVYLLVGVAGVILIFGCRCKTCKVKGMDSGSSQDTNMNM